MRQERQQWRLAQQRVESEDPEPYEIEIREWNYEGSGYRTAGDVCLARNMEEDLRVGRMLSWEEGGARATRAAAETEGGER